MLRGSKADVLQKFRPTGVCPWAVGSSHLLEGLSKTVVSEKQDRVQSDVGSEITGSLTGT